MKKTVRYFITAIGFILVFIFPLQESFARNPGIFLPEIEKAVDQAIAAWTREDTRDLKSAIERLTLNETYLMAVGQSTKERSYLALVPRSLANNLNAVAAYLFLIRKQRQGVSLWPVSFFEGRRFQFGQRGAK